jgi:hypothetical protein
VRRQPRARPALAERARAWCSARSRACVPGRRRAGAHRECCTTPDAAAATAARRREGGGLCARPRPYLFYRKPAAAQQLSTPLCPDSLNAALGDIFARSRACPTTRGDYDACQRNSTATQLTPARGNAPSCNSACVVIAPQQQPQQSSVDRPAAAGTDVHHSLACMHERISAYACASAAAAGATRPEQQAAAAHAKQGKTVRRNATSAAVCLRALFAFPFWRTAWPRAAQ